MPTKVCLVKAMVFPVVMYGCKSWTIKKTECQRIDAFELWCWRRLLGTSWSVWRSNQSMLKEISSENSLEVLMLKLKLQFFVHLMWRTDLLEKTLMLGKIEEFLPSLSPFLSVPSLRRWWEFSLWCQLLPSMKSQERRPTRYILAETQVGVCSRTLLIPWGIKSSILDILHLTYL